jgi:hypothetical protein
MTACHRLGVNFVATCLAMTFCLTEPVVAQSQDATNDAKLEALVTKIETDLGSQPAMPSDILATFTSAIDLAPAASVAGRQMLINLPQRLHERSVERQKSGFLMQSINLAVFSDFVAKELTEHDITVSPTAAITTPAVAVSTAPPPKPPPVALAKPDPDPPKVPAPPAIDQDLLQRGDAMLNQGNVSAARMLYTRAAEDGVGIAALKLGNTYDPDFIAAHHLIGLKPDPEQAEAWYRKAAALGEPQAGPRLKQMASHANATQEQE